ncbi:MAG: hypothetical protein RIS90_1545 [Pseudomonadota bacterium]
MTLRVGQTSASLVALHQAHGVDRSAFLTAYNPLAKQVKAEANCKRQQDDLRQELSSRSLIFRPGSALQG